MRENKNRYSVLEHLSVTGNYTLMVFLESPSRFMVPGLGWFWLKKGYYGYTGSAFGKGAASLKQRVARHLVRKKTKHWHIDYLLASQNARITVVVTGSSSTNIECKIAKDIQTIEGATIPVKGFGASDCRQNCRSHLAYFGETDVCGMIVDIYSRLTRNVKVLRVTST